MKMYDKWIIKNINRLDGKKVIVTGATGTLGYYISYYYLLLGCDLIVAVRNIEKGNRLKETLLDKFPNAKISVEYLDVSKFDTIDDFVKRIEDEKIDILINNAGVYYLKQGYNENNMEIHFATNYFGPYLLTEKIIPILKRTQGKIIFMSSLSYSFSEIDFEDIYAKKVKDKTKIYGRTKRLITLYSLKLKKELINYGVKVELVHPGACLTELFSPQKGNLPKIFYKICNPVMKAVFPESSKASLSVLLASNINTGYGNWIGPKGAFHIWGYPKESKLNKNVVNKELINQLNEKNKKLTEEMLYHTNTKPS